MKFFRFNISLVLCLVFGSIFSQSKSFYDINDFKKKRHELNFGIGMSTCQTDVGGSQYSDQELSKKFGGTIFRSIYDTDVSKSNFALNAAYVYHYKNRINFRGNLIFSRLNGDDKESQEFYRNNRSLNFRTDVLELSSVVEFYLKEPITGNKFNLKNVKGQKLASNALSSWGVYITGGVGGFLFVPRAKNNFNYGNVLENNEFTPDGKKTEYHKLRPLHTEGQGYEVQPEGDEFNVPGKVFKNSKTYKKIAICIPLGVGIQKAFNQDMGVKAELGIRYTFTDYIDDVSGLYYDKKLLIENNGNLAATMSGTNSGITYGNSNEYTYTNIGYKRGNPENNDYYAFLNVSFYKKFSSHGKVYKSIHSKEKRRIKASF